MVKAVSVDRVIEVPQKLGAMTRYEVHSADAALLQCLVGIEHIAEQLAMTGQNLALPQLRAPGAIQTRLAPKFRA